MKSGLITRRNLIVAGLGAAAGAVVVGRFPKKLPPTYGHILRMSDSLTYGVHRALLPGESLVQEYSHADITSFPATGTTNPGVSEKTPLGEKYRKLQEGAFVDWRLPIEGSVRSPREFSLVDLKQLPSRTQITRHTCEEGWTAIGQWTGVPLSLVLDAVGILPSARFIVMHSVDGWIDCLDLMDAFHPQTILAYGMNGRELPVQHGGPLRLRLERQLGYKSMKYLNRIVVTDEFDDGGKQGSIQNGWAWYTGI